MDFEALLRGCGWDFHVNAAHQKQAGRQAIGNFENFKKKKIYIVKIFKMQANYFRKREGYESRAVEMKGMARVLRANDRIAGLVIQLERAVIGGKERENFSQSWLS